LSPTLSNGKEKKKKKKTTTRKEKNKPKKKKKKKKTKKKKQKSKKKQKKKKKKDSRELRYLGKEVLKRRYRSCYRDQRKVAHWQTSSMEEREGSKAL